MKFETVRDHLRGVPYLSPERGKELYDFVLKEGRREILELGFAHGVSSLYIAAALDEAGAGRLTSVDLQSGLRWQKPSIEDLLAKTGLGNRVTVVRERTSYTWFLGKKIEERTQGGACRPLYDFVFIDGPKNWTIDGCAFFLADKLMVEGAWILFDDMNWRYAEAAKGHDASDGVSIRDMGDDERTLPHIERVFRLLVMQHPSYGEFRIEDDWWGWAHKVASAAPQVEVRETASVGTLASRAVRRLGRRLRRGS